MTPFYVSGKEAFSKHCGKRRKCLLPFRTMFSTLSKTEIVIYVTFILSFANAFSFIKSKKLSFGKELKGNVFFLITRKKLCEKGHLHYKLVFKSFLSHRGLPLVKVHHTLNGDWIKVLKQETRLFLPACHC